MLAVGVLKMTLHRTTNQPPVRAESTSNHYVFQGHEQQSGQAWKQTQTLVEIENTF